MPTVSMHGTDLYEALGLAGAAETVVELSPAERFARFVTGVYIAPLLLAVGLVALVVEVLTAGFGVAGLISIIAFALFRRSYCCRAGRERSFISFVAGIILLLIEAFIPGFGVFGIGGLVAIGFHCPVCRQYREEYAFCCLLWSLPPCCLPFFTAT